MITLWIKVNQVSLKTLWMGNDGGNIYEQSSSSREGRGERRGYSWWGSSVKAVELGVQSISDLGCPSWEKLEMR